eukprot:PhM_4_TR6728/c1_g1_i1/m.68599
MGCHCGKQNVDGTAGYSREAKRPARRSETYQPTNNSLASAAGDDTNDTNNNNERVAMNRPRSDSRIVTSFTSPLTRQASGDASLFSHGPAVSYTSTTNTLCADLIGLLFSSAVSLEESATGFSKLPMKMVATAFAESETHHESTLASARHGCRRLLTDLRSFLGPKAPSSVRNPCAFLLPVGNNNNGGDHGGSNSGGSSLNCVVCQIVCDGLLEAMHHNVLTILQAISALNALPCEMFPVMGVADLELSAYRIEFSLRYVRYMLHTAAVNNTNNRHHNFTTPGLTPNPSSGVMSVADEDGARWGGAGGDDVVGDPNETENEDKSRALSTGAVSLTSNPVVELLKIQSPQAKAIQQRK